MLRQAIILWKKGGRQKGSTLQRRLLIFFAAVIVSVILLFALLLTLFGITGSGKQAVYNYMNGELQHVSGAISTDFGNLSATGIELAGTISENCARYFSENNITAQQLAGRPELIEPLIAEQMSALLSTVDNTSCGGVFLMLDATINPFADDAENRKAGVFIKKTQPVSSRPLSAKNYCLRGPAQVARDYGVELMGQWKMEYDIAGQDFFLSVMKRAYENPELPLSRLYYWSDSFRLKGNSENGFLLCVPLRCWDGTVLGLCGIEVSDRMFKQLYSPNESSYQGVFSIAAPAMGSEFHAESGLIAGNAYLTGNRMIEPLQLTGIKNGFSYFSGGKNAYGGLSRTIKLYPSGSTYADNTWTVAVLMPQQLLEEGIKGSSVYLYLIISVLLVISLIASIFISRRYLQPITQALDSIKNRSYSGEAASIGLLEIDDLFDFLEQKDKALDEELKRLDREKRDAEEQYAKAQTKIGHLSEGKKKEIDPDRYDMFIGGINQLTKTQREIFELYLSEKTAKEIVEIRGFSVNTLKYHNKEIYGKLGVSSLKELRLFATLMKQECEKGIE